MTMTEQEWQTSTDPVRMLNHLKPRGMGIGKERVSGRKFLLFAAAVAHRNPNPYFPGRAEDLAWMADVPGETTASGWRIARGWIDPDGGGDQPAAADYLRCVIGNPFRPVHRHDGGACVRVGGAPPSPYPEPHACTRLPSACITPTVQALADAIYAGRAFDRLPVLADALEEAGCDNPDLLAHLRGPGPHVRGCWALDLLLGRG